jgi:hypothetical protein
MKSERRFAKTWVRGITAFIAVCAGLWFITESWGVPQVRRIAVEAMRQPAPATDGTDGDNPMGVPVYRCSAGAYAPLVVRADYQWQNGPKSGEGTAFYLWLFGGTFHIGEMGHQAF